MTGEISLRPFRYTFTTPCDENVLRQPRVWVCHLHIGKLHSALGEFFNEIFQFTIYDIIISTKSYFFGGFKEKEEPTSGALDLQNTLLIARILLEGIDKRG